MLEICPTIALVKQARGPSAGHRREADPARLVFSVPAGPAVNASLIDMGKPLPHDR